MYKYVYTYLKCHIKQMYAYIEYIYILLHYVRVQCTSVHTFFHVQCTSALYTCTYMYRTLIIHEMLRKTRQGNTTQQKDTATQHNSSKAVRLAVKLAASGGTRTHYRQLSRRRSYQLSYRGSSAGWARITYTIQSNQSTSTKASQTR